MSNVTLFSYHQMPVRVVRTDGGCRFVIRDICNILGFSNPNRELAKHTENIPQYERIRTPGGLQVVRLVPQSDVERILDANTGNIAPKLHLWLIREVFPVLDGGSVPPKENAKQPGCEYKPEQTPCVNDEIADLLLGHVAFMNMLMSVPLEEQPGVIFGLPEIPLQLKMKRGRKHAR